MGTFLWTTLYKEIFYVLLQKYSEQKVNLLIKVNLGLKM
jgi:hypothetical protein